VALQVASGMLARDPRNVRALVVQGDAQTMLGEYEPASDSYGRALALDPGSVGAELGLGRLRLGSAPAAAESLFLQALQHDPRNTAVLNDLGIARDLQGRHADAQKAYNQALGLEPDLRAAQVNLALSLAMSGESGRAEQLLRPLAGDPGASRKLRHDLAAVLEMAGKHAEAEHILSADLSPAEVRRALAAYASARSGGPVPLLPATPSGEAAPMQPAALPREIQVQLVASPSEDAAQAEWQRLQERMPGVLGAHRPVIIRAEHDGHPIWRLRTAGFANAAEAESFCQGVRAGGAACVVMNGS
jgi:tetratricopeptide (TPR) repeat protein